MKIPNISLGFSSKKYSHNLSRDCNTTFPFGVCQPVFTQYMLPDSDISVNAKQLLRLAPMPVPSFARVSLRTVTRFVPEHDVVPYSDAFYSRMSFRGFVPTSLPVIDNPTLIGYILSNSNFCLYSLSNGYYEAFDYDIFTSQFATLGSMFSQDGSKAISFLHPSLYVTSDSATALRPQPTPESCDYLIYVDSSTIACFNFGSKAKIFRNICLGLGYSLDMDDFTKVRFSPLLSYFKAYFDTFGIKRFKNWTQTKCFDLLTSYFDSSSVVYNLSISSSTALVQLKLFAFFDEMVDCYYSTQQDFVSIHRDSLNFTSTEFPYPSSSGSSSSVNYVGSLSSDVDSIVKNPNAITQVSLRLLSAVSRFVSKNSILGQRLSDYMRLHYGANEVSSIFEDSNFVDSSVLPCEINDVFSTSDTAQGSGDSRTGELLGSYAGKGIGFGTLSFKYHAQCHGYLITLAAVVPESGYWQGNSCDLFAVDWQSQPSSDFDAIGMEMTPRSAFISHNDISNRASLGIDDLTDKSFGYVPRFSGFKFAKNVVNGDMSRRGTIDQMSPYYLDHIIASNQVYVDKDSKGNFVVNSSSSAVPSGSYDWRYVCKYPWLGNFLRLFVNETGNLVKGSYVPSDKDTQNYPYYCIDDPFIGQIVFNCTVRNCLKPLSLCYDTFNEETDNASKDVSAS